MIRPRSKTVATWLALGLGAVGGQRFYLRGWRDPLGWLSCLPTLIGLVGVWRMQTLGQDDSLSWLLIPWLGLMISVGMLNAILIGLTSDERWAERHGLPGQPATATRWGPIFGVMLALLLGGTALMSTIAYSGEKLFEYLARPT